MREAKRFTEFLRARIERRAPERFYFSKMETKDIARECGLHFPETFGVYDNPEDVIYRLFKIPFVVKPTGYASKNGVRILTDKRSTDDRYWDAMSSKWLSAKFMRERHRALLTKMPPRPDNKFIVEEFIEGENEGIPYDYKVYMIGEYPAFIVQIDRNVSPSAMAFYRDGFEPTGDADVVIGTKNHQGERAVPRNAGEIIKAARLVAGHIKSNFVSVDLYTNGSRVTLGEITHCPGGPYFGSMFRFTPKFDREMGERLASVNKAMGIPIPTIIGEAPVMEVERLAGEAR